MPSRRELLALPALALVDGIADAQPRPADAPELLLRLVQARYPNANLGDDELKKIQQRLVGALTTGNLLQRVPIDNSIEPDFLFDADVN